MPLKTANPGELIRAADWNELVAAHNALAALVADLSNGGPNSPPRIVQVLPSGIVTAGDQIRIFGSNFGFSQGAHGVFFGNTRATMFLGGSSDTLLIVQIPDPVADATAAGTPLTMTVSNLHGFTTSVITIKSRPVVTTGQIQFSYKGSRPATPAQNGSVFYDFELKSLASQDLVVTLTPTIQVIPPLPAGVPDPGLPALLAVLDSDATVKLDGRISLPEGTTKTVSLRLNLPNNVNGVRYSFAVTAQAPGVSSVVEALPDQEVGQAGEQPDPTIVNFDFSSFVAGSGTFAPDAVVGSGLDGALSIPRGTTATIDVGATFLAVGPTINNYMITAAMDAPANGWSVAVDPVIQNPLPAGTGAVSVFFDLVAPSTAATAIVRLTLTRQGVSSGNRKTVAYRLQST